MSHIHLPDGVLPPWLWISGFVVALIVWIGVLRPISKKEGFSKRLPLLGMMSAIMVLAASVEILPIAYHMNLTAISGILLGPSLIYLATFLVNFILALLGHGGLTVVGLNTLILSIEGILAYYLFHIALKALKRVMPAAFVATFIALLCSTVAMIAVIGLGTHYYAELMHGGGKKGLLDFWHLNINPNKTTEEIHLARFVTLVVIPAFFGWVLEGLITALVLRYLHRIRPELLPLKGETL